MCVDVLPRYERYFYWVSGISSIAYSVYTVYQEGEKNKEILKPAHFVPGWNWIGRDKDDSDYGWRMWTNLVWTMVPMNIIHVILSQALCYFKANDNIRSWLLTIFHVTMVCYTFGTRTGVFLLTVALVMYMTSLLHSLALVWLMALTLITSTKLPSVYQVQVEYLQISNDYVARQYYISFPLFCVRLLSFAVENVKYRKTVTDIKTLNSNQFDETKCCHPSDKSKNMRIDELNRESNEHAQTHTSEDVSNNDQRVFSRLSRHTNPETVNCDPSVLHLLFYSFYLPVFFWGPVFIYRDFHSDVNRSFKTSTSTVHDIAKHLFKIVFYSLFIEVQFHFIYFRSIGLNKTAVEGMSLWALWGVYFCQAQFFMLKYFVIYGVGIHISRFDGLAPLAMPRCISWVYSYSDLWRHFDVGLYNFIKNYIYIPLGGSRAGILRQFIAFGVSFLFIFLWHGANERVLLWCTGNSLMCIFEATAVTLDKSAAGVSLKRYLSPSVRLRLKAICIYPVILTSSVQFLYFFFGADVGWVMFSKFVLKASWFSIATQYFLITCSIHNALYISQWYRNRKRDKLHNS